VPKLVDHEERRRELGDAVWRVIRSRGVDGASIRTVAREAGWSPGALRHYFSTQSELLTFAMQMVVERIEARVSALEPPADPRRAVEQRLHELLPLDKERRAENAFAKHSISSSRPSAYTDCLTGLLCTPRCGLTGCRPS
jgi:AcrR family transcriptional regulator